MVIFEKEKKNDLERTKSLGTLCLSEGNLFQVTNAVQVDVFCYLQCLIIHLWKNKSIHNDSIQVLIITCKSADQGPQKPLFKLHHFILHLELSIHSCIYSYCYYYKQVFQKFIYELQCKCNYMYYPLTMKKKRLGVWLKSLPEHLKSNKMYTKCPA